MKEIDLSLWSLRLEEERKERERGRLEALQRAVESLRAYFEGKPVKKVILCGSILEEGRFYPFSDIDVAVDGAEEEYLRTMTDLEAMLDRNVDLIEFRKCRFRDAIERKGMRII